MNNGSFDPNEYGNGTPQQQPAPSQPNDQQPNYQQPNYQQPNRQQSYQQPNPQQAGYQQNHYQQPPYQAYQPPVKKPQAPAMGQAIAAMVCGIVSIVSHTLPPAIVAIVLAGVAKSRGNRSGIATAGLVTGIVGTVIAVIYLIIKAIARAYGISFFYDTTFFFS